MKKIIIIGIVGCAVVFIDAQLRIRQQNPTWRADELACCADRRHAIVPYGVAGAVEAIDALREEIIDKYDSGLYMAEKVQPGWQKDRNEMLEIQSHIGFTPEEDDAFDSSYDE